MPDSHIVVKYSRILKGNIDCLYVYKLGLLISGARQD